MAGRGDVDGRGPAAVRAVGVGFRYAGRPVPALDGIDLAIDPGECLLVVGPSGSGKSTLALAIAGLVPREFAGDWTGELTVDGIDPAAGPAALGGRVGSVFQDPASQVVMERVEDDVAFGLENRAWPLAAMQVRVPDALETVGLVGFGRRRSIHLSGGEQQRLALAGVLAPRPGLLVLDEPTANLDPDGARAFLERLAAIRAARAATIVLVEHRVELAWPLADRILALGRDGRLIDLGTPEAVVARSGGRLRDAGIWLPERIERALIRRGGPTPLRRPAPRPLPVGRPVVEATDVSFGYVHGAPVVRGGALTIAAGERVALRGPNGSGKSTLARLLVGLLRPDAGRIRLDGADPARLPAAELARRAGYVFQDPERQFLTSGVAGEVMLGLRPSERAGVERLMAALGLPLESFGSRSPYTLSGGEERRLSLACALVRRPRLLVLDEPTFGQDRRGVEGLLAILADRVEEGTAVLAVTHDDRFAAAFAERSLIMADGRVSADAGRDDGAAARPEPQNDRSRGMAAIAP